MRTLTNYLAMHDWNFVCPNCDRTVYKYIGEIPPKVGSVVSASMFMAVSSKIPQPSEMETMQCPLCRKEMAWQIDDGTAVVLEEDELDNIPERLVN